MHFTCDEMGIAFDRFILSLAKRYARHSNRLHILSGKSFDDHLKNYVLIVQDTAPELTLVEYRISIEDFRHVSSRVADVERLVQRLTGAKPLDTKLAKRYLLLGNESTCESEDNVEIVKGFDAELSLRWPALLPLMQAIRLDSDLGRANVLELSLQIGEELKTVKQLLLGEYKGRHEEVSFPKYYPADLVVKHGMSLLDLFEDIKYGKLDLGVFLVRDAEQTALITHIQPVRDLKDVTSATSFVVSDTISINDLCQLCPVVHEVIYRADYGIVYWQRSSGGGTGMLRKYLTVASTQDYDERPPPLHWLNVIHADQTAGKSTFLKLLKREYRRVQPFGLVRLIDGAVLEAALADGSLSTVERLAKLFRMESQLERRVVQVLVRQKDAILVLIDDAKQVGALLVQLLEEVERDLGTSVKFWIAARDKLRKQIKDRFAVVAHEFPPLDKVQQADCLEMLLPELSAEQIEETLKIARTCNVQLVFHETSVEYPVTENIFILQLIADMAQVDESRRSYYLPDLIDLFIDNNLTDIVDLERKCYELRDNDQSILQLCKYSTVVEYMAARYLSKHVELVNLALYRDFPRIANFLDQLLSRHDKLGTAVLNKDTERVLKELESYQESLDCLNRNPLHLSHDCLTNQEALIAAGLQLEQRCLLSDYTPLQLADDRQDWKFVNLLLQNRARHDFPTLRLCHMPTDQVERVIASCISFDLNHLLDWILTNRPDYHITQRNIYSLSVYSNTMEHDLMFRLLNRAYEQKLRLREPPYRFMWGSTGLHMAAYNGSLAVCQFLVEKLNFSADLKDYAGQTALDEASDVGVVEYLNSLNKDSQQKEVASDPELEQHVADSAFIRACNSNNLELVRYCVEQEGHERGHEFMKPERGQYGFINATAWGYLPIVEYLFEKGFKDQLDIEDSSGYTALATAVRYEHFQIVQFLVEHGANVSKIQDAPKNSELRRYLQDRCQYNLPITFEYLSELRLDELRTLEYDFTTENEDGEVFLHYYIEYHEDAEVLKFLLTQYTNVDLESKHSGRTPLLEAILAHKAQFIDILLEAGADVYKTCAQTGRNVLHLAAQQGNKRLLDLFLNKYRIGIDSRDNEGQTVAFYLESNASLFRYLVERYGMDVNAQNNEGCTVLHEKIISEGFFHLHEVEYLLREVGVRQNVVDRRGRLALHYAAERGNVKVVQLLERYGALGWNIRDANGKNPLDLAKEAAQESFLEYFERLNNLNVV